MSSVVPIVGLFLIGIGIAGVGYGYRRRRQRAAIASVETTDALRVTPGPAEVYGTAEPADDGGTGRHAQGVGRLDARDGRQIGRASCRERV